MLIEASFIPTEKKPYQLPDTDSFTLKNLMDYMGYAKLKLQWIYQIT
jgi:hypothetical protein